MQQIQDLYLRFLNLFPPILHPVISIIIVVVIVYSAIQVLKKNFIYLILLVILLPASLPILRMVGQSIIDFIKFILRIS